MSVGGAKFKSFGPFFNNSGVLYRGIKIDVYAAGTTTNQTYWTDEDKITPGAFPLEDTDQDGQVIGYFDGDYRFRVKDSSGLALDVPIDWDNVNVTSDTATLLESNHGTSLPSITPNNKWQMFAKHTAGDALEGLFINDGISFSLVVDAFMAKLNVAQTFTKAQTIKNLFPQFIAETTGQTAKGRIIEYDSRVFMSWNGYRDAAGWQRDDQTFPSWLFGMGDGSGDLISAFYSPAGTGLVVFVPVFSFDSAGKMTSGTVPLSRTGFNGSFVTAALLVGGTDDRIISHGLGTDDVIVLVRGKGSFSNTIIGGVFYPDGTSQSWGTSAWSGGVPDLSGATPSTGDIRFVSKNTGALANILTIEYTIMRRT